MSGKILSSEDIEAIRGNVSHIHTCVDNALTSCRKVYDSFTNEAIVQSFYASGKYGQKEKEEIEKIMAAIEKYYAGIAGEGGLIEQTNTFLNNQAALLDSGSVGTASTNYYNSGN